jgi:nicotinamide-nucleotide amidase
MRAEIISIGDEITRGQTLDTNSQWLSQQLQLLGVTVSFHTTVADELVPNVEAFRLAIARADVVVASGGLGPTADDLTREVLAQVTGQALVLEPRALEHIRGLFARRKRPMPPQNDVQAYLPAGSQMIDNPHGTAPGIYLEVARADRAPCRVIALPGVPAEMKEMWQQSVVARLKAAGAGGRVFRFLNLRCFGAGESQIESLLPDLIRRGRRPTVGITASQATITLRIAAEGDSEEECLSLIEPTAATIRRCLGSVVYGEGDDQLQDVVLRRLAQQGKTLASVECGTGALLADALAGVSESAARGVYRGGIAGGDALQLLEALGDTAAPEAAGVDALREVTAALARACRTRFQADYGLAVGPLPAAAPDAADPPPVFAALATPDGLVQRNWPFILHPALVKIYFVKQALNVLRLILDEPKT